MITVINPQEFDVLQFRKEIINATGKKHRKNKVTINFNSSVLLHYILISIKFTNGKFVFCPTEETKKILNTFTQLDLVDTYSHLEICPGFYPLDYVHESNVYVIKKTEKIMRKNHNKFMVDKNGKKQLI